MKAARWFVAVALVLFVILLLWRGVQQRALAAVVRADPETVLADPVLAATALPLGRAIFAAHCATCHGPNGAADTSRGIPSLHDTEFLYGIGRVVEIESIVRHGIRSGDRKGWNLAAMPAYASVRPYLAEPIPPLTPQGVADTTQFLLSFTGRATDRVAAERGSHLYSGTGGCWDCHGVDAAGDPAVGAPNLTDNVWLYGDGSAPAISRSLEYGRAGISPAFARTLDAAQIRAVSVYVASLPIPFKPEDAR
ncbi:MAG: c-type cytochrome [Sphingomonadales bacterium]|nr:c-type cytochrome [Sphingomonadales bacterium]